MDKYAILAQISRWADMLDSTAPSMNDHALPVVQEMRRFVIAVLKLDAGDDHAV